MSDVELIKKCAYKMGGDVSQTGSTIRLYGAAYDPLHNDAQAMALVKKFELVLFRVHHPETPDIRRWQARPYQNQNTPTISSADLNRAIVECVANLP
jgi:hypothetical protein